MNGPGHPDVALARQLFAPLIPDLAIRSTEFETDVDVVDDELIELLAAEIDAACAGLATAIPAGDEAAIREHAHALQGMGGAASVSDVSVVGEEFSAAARQQQFERCAALLHALQQWRDAW